MPGFQTWGLSTQTARFPPTPPAYQPPYQTSAGMMYEKGYYPGHPESQPRTGQTGCDFIERYSQGPAHNSQRSVNVFGHVQASQMYTSQLYQKFPSCISQRPALCPYGNIATAPPLPPIRARDHTFDAGAAQFAPQDAHTQMPLKAKDEKPSGGVAAYLDYDIDLMADFVAEMAQGMYAKLVSGICLADIDLMRSVSPGCHPSTAFHKYVVQILSSTRLPSSTIVLGLFYLASRMKLICEEGEVARSGTVNQMLTTCLLLGSKFLDDNTFQNRSWADVSHIPVAELNKMELDWLKGFGWVLHGPMYRDSEGFYVWREHWKAYEADAQVAKVRGNQKLTRLDTNVACVQQSVRHPLMSPEGPIPVQYQRPAQYDTQWPRQYISEYSPPSASYSGPTTPDYYANGSWPQAPPPYSRQPWSNNNSSFYSLHGSKPPSYQPTPNYFQSYFQSFRKSHELPCTNNLCSQHPEHYSAHPAVYGIQSVAG